MFRNISYAVKCLLGCILLGGLAAGCVQEDLGEVNKKGMHMPASYVSLSLISASDVSTRANPTGGENGDGTEQGQDYENTLSSVVVFFFQGDEGINAAGTTPIDAVVTFHSFKPKDSTGEGGNGSTYTTDPQQVDLENGSYHVLVIANADETRWMGKPLTLDDVRNHIQTEAWKSSGSGYSDFIMTSAADATLTLNSNPADDPATAIVHIERMAARIDYKAEAAYECTNPAYTGASVEITGAALVNNLTAGSYLMKRVADDVTGNNLTYLGDETAGAGGAAINYVLDPWTAEKTADNNSFTINDEVKQAKALYGTWFGERSPDPNHWADYVGPGTPVSAGTETWQRIGYTLENTTAAAEAGNRYSTGVVFKAKFHPDGVLNYADGQTFFALGTHLFASMEDMMTFVYGGTVFNSFDSRIEACTSWDDLKQFASLLLDNDPSGYKVFLQEQDETADFATVKADLKWKTYMLNQCGYSAAKETNVYQVILDQNDKITRIALQPYSVRTYEDAVCYYTWWVRHANDNDNAKKGVMEYAIVRNNIYKLSVNSVYSLGGEVPGEDDNIMLDVYVNDWLLLDGETLPM